jgi:hypothetical protein
VSVDLLDNRQRFICYLCDTDELSHSLKNFLRQLAPHESFLQVSQGKDVFADNALERVYFSLPPLKKFNTSSYALYFAYVAHILGICAPLAEHIALHIGIDLLASHKHCGHHGHGHGHNKVKKGKHGHHGGHDLSYYGLQILHWGLHVPGLYDMGADIWQRALLMKHLQGELIHIASYVKNAKNIYALLHQHARNEFSVEAYSALSSFFGSTPTCSDACTRLFELLECSTFEGGASVFNNVGNVLATYRLYQESQDELRAVVQAIGEVDVWVSAAEIMSSSTASSPWCFVNYLADASPSIIANNLRHLFIAEEKVRGWDVCIKDVKHTFITGDNGAGKSTYLNGTGHAIILAQTLGIAPAAYFALTPFANICTYRFIEDNIFEGTSRFYAECARLDKILQIAKDCNGFCCVLLDEPFTSTHVDRGRQNLQEALSAIFSMAHVVSFTSTHYGALKTLMNQPENVLNLHLS